MRLEGQINKLQKQAKVQGKKISNEWKERKEVVKTTDNTTGRNKSKDIGEKIFKKYKDRMKQYKQNKTFKNNERKSSQNVRKKNKDK